MHEGWKYQSLGDVCEVINGLWTGKKEPFVTVAVIRNTNFSKDCRLKLDDVAFIDVETKQFKTRKLKYGDIIIEKSGGSEKQPVGRAVLFDITEGDYSFSNFTATLRIKQGVEISPTFLHKCLYGYYIKGETLKMQSKTTGLHNLDMKAFLRLPIPDIPFDEQERIVSELNLLSTAIDKQKQLLLELNTLALSVFHELFENKEERGWRTVSLGDVAVIKGGYTPTSSELFSEGVYPYFKVGDMNGDNNQKYLRYSSSFANPPRRTFPKDAIVFPKNGAAIATNKKRLLDQESIVDLNTAILIFDKALLCKQYVYYWIQGIDFRTITRRGAVPTLDTKELLAKQILIPPQKVQEGFEKRIEFIEHQINTIKLLLEESQRLFDYTMDKYFG